MSTNDLTTISLGQEYDSGLLARLRAAVSSRGGNMGEASYIVGGSQEVIRYKIVLPGGTLQAEGETYIGLSISGPTELVTELARAVQIR